MVQDWSVVDKIRLCCVVRMEVAILASVVFLGLLQGPIADAGSAYDPVYKDEIQALYCGQNPPAVLLNLDHTSSMERLGDNTCTRTEEMLLTLLGEDAFSTNGGDVKCNPEDPSAEDPFVAPSVGLLEVLSGWVDIGVYLFNGRILHTRGEYNDAVLSLHGIAKLEDVSDARRKTPGIDMYNSFLKKKVQEGIKNRRANNSSDLAGRKGLTPMLRSIIASVDTLNQYSESNQCTSYTAVTLGDGRATVEEHKSGSKPWSDGGIDACSSQSLNKEDSFSYDDAIQNVACPVRYYADPDKFVYKKAVHNNRFVMHGIGYDLSTSNHGTRTFEDMEYVQTKMEEYPSNGAKSFVADDTEALYQSFISQILVSLNSTLPTFSFSFANPALMFNSRTGYHDNVVYEAAFSRPPTYGLWAGNIWKHCMVGAGSSECESDSSSQSYLSLDAKGKYRKNSERFDMWTGKKREKAVDQGGLGEVVAKNLLTLTRPVLSYNGSGAYRTIQVPAGAAEAAAKSQNQSNFGGSVFSNRFESTINYILGFNFSDTVSKSWGRWPLGGFIHSRGVTLKYKISDREESVILVIGGNDGMLHFVDDSNGQIFRSILPYDLLPQLEEFYRQPTDIDLDSEESSVSYSITKASNLVKYGVDGDLTLLHHDTNQDGMIESGEKAWLLFGLGRGGEAYYALDVGKGKDAAPTLIAMNYPKFPSKLDQSKIESNGFSALRETWASPTLSVHLEDEGKKPRDIAIVGSGHDKFYDRDSESDQTIYMPSESGTPHTEGPTIYSTSESTETCLNALSMDKTNKDKDGKLKIPKTETKLCDGSFYDGSTGDGASQGYPGYPWYDAPIKVTPLNHSVSDLTTHHGYSSQSNCGSQPSTPSNFELHKCDTSTCSCGFKCTTTYYTCYFYKKEFDYFYDLPTNDLSDSELADEERTGKTKKMTLRFPRAYAYKVDFKHLDIGSGDVVQIKDELGKVLQTIVGPNPVYDSSGKMTKNVTSTNWIYAKKIVVKVITDGDNPNPHNQTQSYWGRGVQIGDIHYKQKFNKRSITWSGLGPSIYVLDLGPVDDLKIPTSVSFNTDPDPLNRQIYKRFTKSCGSATHNCVDSFDDLKYMNYPISAKATVIQKGGYFFRSYIGDEGGQIWRVSYDRTSTSWKIVRVFKTNDFSSNLEVNKVLKFFTQVDVAVGDCMQGGDNYAVFFGTGDPQRPQTEMSDVVGMFIDTFDSSLNSAVAFTLKNLEDVTSTDLPNYSSASSEKKGWFLRAKESLNEESLKRILDLDGNLSNFSTFRAARGALSSSKMLRAPRVFDGKVYYKLYDGYGSCKPTNLCEGYPSSRNRLVVRDFCTGNYEHGYLRDLGSDTSVGYDFMTFFPESGESILFVDGVPLAQRKQNLETLFLRKGP